MNEGDFGRYPRPKKKASTKPIEEVIRELKKPAFPYSDYRERSLKIHGLICAKCGREFDYKSRNLLTVHHKDLCVYCHEDEHSRELLGKYLTDQDKKDE
jgi:hypothetical protein